MQLRSASRVSRLILWVMLVVGIVVAPTTVLAKSGGSPAQVEPYGGSLPRPPKIYLD